MHVVEIAATDVRLRGAIAQCPLVDGLAGTKKVTYQHVRREAVLFEQLAHQFHRRSLVASPLHQQIENLAFVVDRSPEPESPAGDQNCHLVQMPMRGGPMTSAAKFLGEQRPELQHPSSDRS